MEYTTLGRTGLHVSRMGLGAGGPSRLGQRERRPEADSIRIIHMALDAGVNFIDTAEAYGTESIVGQAIAGRDRAALVLSTKKATGPEVLTPAEVRAGLEASLKRLGTDYVDIYHLHGVKRDQYAALYEAVMPTLHDLRAEGKLRAIGITEAFGPDPGHVMLREAVAHDDWDVMMVGFNLLNQSARDRVFPHTQAHAVGVLVMFAVRLALSRPDKLVEVLREGVDAGQIDPAEIDWDDPLGFVRDGGALDLTDAAYRFCRDEPGCHVILSGTGNPDHLRANLDSFARPPLDESTTARLRHIFRHVDTISGQ